MLRDTPVLCANFEPDIFFFVLKWRILAPRPNFIAESIEYVYRCFDESNLCIELKYVKPDVKFYFTKIQYVCQYPLFDGMFLLFQIPPFALLLPSPTCNGVLIPRHVAFPIPLRVLPASR